MHIYVELTLREIDTEHTKAESRRVWHHIQRIFAVIAKYVVFDKDAIFKDPDWPHLWS
ncbi:hypothetical protein ACFLYR_08535 [Chloroflexota bacterium]